MDLRAFERIDAEESKGQARSSLGSPQVFVPRQTFRHPVGFGPTHLEHSFFIRWTMSTKDQFAPLPPFTAPRRGTPSNAATWTNPSRSCAQIADGRNDILAEAAGKIAAGAWYANPASHVGYELIGAGMLILAGGGRGFPLDYDELERWTRVGYERGTRSRNGER